MYAEKKREFMTNSGCFGAWQKGVFSLFFLRVWSVLFLLCFMLFCCWSVLCFLGFVVFMFLWFCWLLFVLFACVATFLLCFICLVVCVCVLACFWFGSLCLLERSRCCSWFVLFWFVLFVFVFCLFVLVSLCFFLSVSYGNHWFPCNSCVFGLMFIQSLFLMSISGSCFLFFGVSVSRCSFVYVLFFLLVVLLCFESQY